MSDYPVSIEIKPDPGTIEAWDKATRGIIKPSEFSRALAQAINRTLAEMRTAAFKEVTRQYTVKRKDVAGTVTDSKASVNNLSAELRFSGGRIPLLKFRVKPAGGFSFAGRPRQGRSQLFVQIRKDSGGPAPGLFVRTMGREPAVYKRTGPGRFPVTAETGPSIVSMVGNEEAVAAIQGRADTALAKRLDHEMKRILSR